MFLLKTRLIVILVFVFTRLSVSATTFPINVSFSGVQEAPPNASTATGTFVGTYNDAADSLIYTVTFSGLSANVTAAHFHGYVPPGIAGPVIIAPGGFPTGVMSGSFTDTLVLTAGQEDSLKMGLIYFNIHTSAFPGGEIRAQIFLQDASFVLPDINCPNDTTTNADTGLCSDTVAFTATTTAGTPTPALYYRIGTAAISSPHVFPVGTTTVIATALNTAGFDTCSFNVTVRDVQAPVISCPANITAPNDSGQCGAVVNFSATATDNCPGVTVVVAPASGSFFPVGTTTVTVTATDASGNTSTCSFTVTVNDVEPPRIDSLAVSRPILWPPNHKMKNVMVNYTSSDNCPGQINCSLTVSSDEPENGLGDGDTSPDWQVLNDHLVKLRSERSGTGDGRLYTIVVSCTDQHGNTSTDTVTVLVPKSLFSAIIRDLIHQYGINGNGPRSFPGASGLLADVSSNMVILNENDEENITLVRIYPNPSRSYFTVNIETTNEAEPISIRVVDIAGRVVEVKNKITGSQSLRIGSHLRTGIYIAVVRQGDNVKTFKLLKQE